MDYVSKMGLLDQVEFSYLSGVTGESGTCPKKLKAGANAVKSGNPEWFNAYAAQKLADEEEQTNTPGSNWLQQIEQSSSRGTSAIVDGGLHFGMTGYRRLPENQLEPLLFALYEQGPVAVSIAAGYAWNFYQSGILDTCSQDAVIDHAVALVGYGVSGSDKYWQLQNSWGKDWGEKGFIRILRHDHSEESKFCGWDREPLVGSGCKGGPPEVYVCGHCGIMYDMVIPTFELSKGSWWYRNGKTVSP